MEKSDRNVNLVAWTGGIIIVFVILITLIFRLNLVGILIMGWLLTFFYAVFAFIMLRESREIIKEVQKPIYVDRPVEKPVYIEKPIDRPVYVDKPVYVEKKVYVDRPVEKPVYIEKKRRKLNIPKYAFLASTETRTYHTRNCRLGKLIKRKYKLSSNTKRTFIRKRFKACKICIKKQKRV